MKLLSIISAKLRSLATVNPTPSSMVPHSMEIASKKDLLVCLGVRTAFRILDVAVPNNPMSS